MTAPPSGHSPIQMVLDAVLVVLAGVVAVAAVVLAVAAGAEAAKSMIDTVELGA